MSRMHWFWFGRFGFALFPKWKEWHWAVYVPPGRWNSVTTVTLGPLIIGWADPA